MSEQIQRFSQTKAADMIRRAGARPIRYIDGIGQLSAQALKENSGAVDTRVSVALRSDGEIITLIQAYGADGKPIGEALSGHRPCPPCCPKCPGDDGDG